MTIFNALVIGYYNHHNLGDESYKTIMPKFFPNHDLDFISSDNLDLINPSNYHCIIVGGGDIINDYFNNRLQPILSSFFGPKILFSVGFPFPELITTKYLEHYDKVFTRNYEDLRLIQQVVGAHNVHYIPDITLAYDTNELERTKTCAVFLVGNIINYPNIIDDLCKLICKIALTYKVVFYCFNPKEDLELSKQVQKSALSRLRSSYTNRPRLKKLLRTARESSNIVVDPTEYNTEQMLEIIASVDFAVCMRYHSHLFSIITKTPFLSISSTRKTRLLMEKALVPECQYKIPLDSNSTPLDSDYSELKQVCSYVLKNKADIVSKLELFLEYSRSLLSSNQASCFLTTRCRTVEDNTINFINDTGDYQNAARILSNCVTGTPDSPCIVGLADKLSHSTDLHETVNENIEYMLDIEFSADDHEPRGVIPINIDINQYTSYKDVHRGGWYKAIKLVHDLSSENGIICDMYIDRTFHWCNSYMKYKGIIPYTGPWCGFIHHTPDTSYSEHNTTNLLNNSEFIISLHTCKALFVLSERIASYLRSKLPDINIITFNHPVVPPLYNFTPSNYCNNNDRKLINIGAWMRNPFTIYRLANVPIKRAILLGKGMDDYIPPEGFKIMFYENDDTSSDDNPDMMILPCRTITIKPRWVIMLEEWLKSINIQPVYYNNSTLYIRRSEQVKIPIEDVNNNIYKMIKQVEVIEFQSNSDYDELLSKNVVFLDLVDAAAVNTIIECIVRCAPVIVNKIPGTVALLGEDYPLFYTDLSQVTSLINLPMLNLAHNYLASLDTDRYTIPYFIDHLTQVVNKL